MFTQKIWALLAVATFALAASSFASRVRRITYDDRPRAAALAAESVPVLARLEAELGRWPEDPGAREVLLAGVRAEIERKLAAPELAAARDYILQDDPRPSAAFVPRKSAVVFAAFRPAEMQNGGGTYREPEDRRGERLAARLRVVKVYAEHDDLLISICAVASPKREATLRLWPVSYPAGALETVTPETLRVYRGLYAYRAQTRGRERKIECDRSRDPTCPRLDLMIDSSPSLLCDFDQGVCSLKSKKPRGCPG